MNTGENSKEQLKQGQCAAGADKIQQAAEEARTRVSGYSKEKRASLLAHGMQIAAGETLPYQRAETGTAQGVPYTTLPAKEKNCGQSKAEYLSANRVRHPLIPSATPGTVNLTNAQIEDFGASAVCVVHSHSGWEKGVEEILLAQPLNPLHRLEFEVCK